MRGTVLRMRPDAVVRDGLLPDELDDLVQALTGQSALQSKTFGFALETDLQDSEAFESLLRIVRQSLAAAELVLVDMRFDSAILRGITICDALLSSALFQIEDELTAESMIVVLVEHLPTTADELHDVLELDAFDSRLVFVDESGAILGAVGDLDLDPVVQASLATPHDLLETIRKGTIRRRGVHSDTPPHVGHYLFQYDALTEAHDAFSQVIADYLVAARVEVLVFDQASAGAWFESCLGRACINANVTRLNVTHLRDGYRGSGFAANDSVARALSKLNDPVTRVCYLIPAYDSGQTITNLRALVKRKDLDTARFLTVFLNEKHVVGRRKSIAGLSSIRRLHEGIDVKLDYILPVRIQKLSERDWRVQAAELMDEVERVPKADIDPHAPALAAPTQVAMWSLFAEYGADIEKPLPDSPRDPIRHFPMLGGIDPWDAHWLAESIVASILETTPSVREGLTIVLPAENSAMTPISQALVDLCGVFVCEVPRENLDAEVPALPESKHADLERHSADTIVILDESAISHATLRILSSLVELAAERRPSLFVTLVDLGEPTIERLKPSLTFTRWTPFETAPRAAV
jgi:hypothetical protein